MVKILNYRADIQEINPAFDILQESNNRLEFVNNNVSADSLLLFDAQDQLDIAVQRIIRYIKSDECDISKIIEKKNVSYVNEFFGSLPDIPLLKICFMSKKLLPELTKMSKKYYKGDSDYISKKSFSDYFQYLLDEIYKQNQIPFFTDIYDIKSWHDPHEDTMEYALGIMNEELSYLSSLSFITTASKKELSLKFFTLCEYSIFF